MQSASQCGKIAMSALFVAMMLIQLVACHELDNDGDSLVPSDSTNGDLKLDLTNNFSNTDSAQDFPLVLVRQQSSNGNSGGGNSNGDRKPDFFLIWLLPYESTIPKPLLDMINQQVRPQTEQVSEQVLSQVPGGQEFWSQLSQLLSIINNAGGLQNVLGSMTGGGSKGTVGNSSGAHDSSGSNPLSSMLQGFGRRR